MTNQELKNGFTFNFNNEDWCTENRSDDFRQASVWYSSNSSRSWMDGFKIMFNGELLHSSKTFPSMVKRLNALTSKWNLKLDSVEDENGTEL